jgi:hypothetical protein
MVMVEEQLLALNVALDKIETLNRSIDILEKWQDEALEVDPDLDTKIMYNRKLKENVKNNSKM